MSRQEMFTLSAQGFRSNEYDYRIYDTPEFKIAFEWTDQ